MTIQAVIFDIGNVLIEWQPERFYDAKIGREKREALFAEVDLHGMNEAIDLGGPFKEGIYATAEKYPEWREEIRMWYDHWIVLGSPEIPHSIHLLRTLRRKSVPVFALSNFGVDSFAYAQTKYPVLSEFDRFYISGHMKCTKPSAQIYQLVEEDCGIEPASLLFADDRTDNIDAAAARGWQTHLFEKPEAWAKCLVDHSLLTEEEATFA